jgi:Ca2+-binding RTX toxin-like protein
MFARKYLSNTTSWTSPRGLRWPAALLGVLLATLALAPTAGAATFTVTSTADSGPGSLRQAITDANAAGAGNTIAFAIPGSGPHTIAPASALPTISPDNTTIDGCTQPGTDCSALPLTLKVRLDGQGLSLLGFGITIRGLSFTGSGTAITLNRIARNSMFTLQEDVTVEHTYIGLAPDGSAAGKSAAFQLQQGNRNVNPYNRFRIAGNVIGANASPAINAQANGFSRGLPVRGMRITGNIIGLDPTGTQPRPNAGDGIVFDISSDLQIVGNRIGANTGVGIRHRGRTQATPGTDPAVDPGLLIEDNVVEGNGGGGIALEPDGPILVPSAADPYSGPVNILGNTIADNGGAGIATTATADTIRPNLRIGGTAAGQANTITGNDGPGVAVGPAASDTSVAVTVRGNSIYANTGPSIDLASDGPTANGPAGSARSGPNALINFPVIGELAHGSLIVEGTYEGAPSSDFTLDFYKSETADGPQTWVGSKTVATDAGGTAAYSGEFDPDVPEGWYIRATATGADGSTSELGDAAVVPPVPPPPPPPTGGGPTPPDSDGVIRGTPGNDVLVGTAGDDRIECGAGDDRVIAGPGDDVVDCGPGDDIISGSDGEDRLRGDSGNDRIAAGGGDDRLSGGPGNDRLAGEAGNDRLLGGVGGDRLFGGSGGDRLAGEAGGDRLAGGSAGDLLFGGAGGDRLAGQSGDDRGYGYGGDDVLFGGTGNDRLSGHRGNDRLAGEAGSDRLFGRLGDDKLFGGLGHDLLSGGAGRNVLLGGPGLDRLIAIAG